MKHPRCIGALSVTAGMVLLFGLFWGFGWFTNWNSWLFTSTSEDFVKDLYTNTWHVAYDNDAIHCGAMNYPYGEYHTFSGIQPLLTTPLQMLRQAGVPHPEQAVLPILNLVVILSVILCALFLYLLFYELKLPVWYSVTAALLVTLLSPQLQRMGGHITLSFYCVIPLLLYLTLRHMRSGGWGWSLAIGTGALLFGLCHPYYMMFFLMVSLTEHLWMLCRRGERPTTGWWLLSLALQVVLPLLLFHLATTWGLAEGNRTAVPNGLYQYQANPAGLFLPYGRIYFLNDGVLLGHIKWEARSYVGIVALVAAALVLWHFIYCLIRRRWDRILQPTGHEALNMMLLASVLLVIYACGIPLDMLPRNLPNYLGPLAQIRAMGRLSWLFFYVINVVAFYLLYHWWRRSGKRWRHIVLVLALLAASFEAWAYNYRNRDWYTAKWDLWTDYDNILPENQWVDSFDASQYQAILPLPVFNVGSEYFYLTPQGRTFRQSALLSVKTGLPMVCNESSRSDIDQAWDCIALTRTAWRTPALASAFPDGRPLLLALEEGNHELSPLERQILSLAQPVASHYGLRLYSLQPKVFYTVTEMTQDSLRRAYAAADSTADFLLKTDVIERDLHMWGLLGDLTVTTCGEMELSFWMGDILTDMFSRSILRVNAYNEVGQSTHLFESTLEWLIDIVDPASGDGLIRLSLTLPEGTTRLQVEMRNPYVKPTKVLFRRMLLRPTGTHAAFHDGGMGYIDNIPIIEPSDYVELQNNRLMLHGEPWFPLMVNYITSIDVDHVVPATWYTGDNMREHFDTIASWGFNAVRICLDKIRENSDTAAVYHSIRHMVQQADSAGLRVMLLTRAPFNGYWRDYTIGLMKQLADIPALWAYDLMNEPLYFDPEPKRDKAEAAGIVSEWRKLVRTYAPKQLFTVATAEPIEVFEWDPAMLPVDFIEMHTYHPLRVQAEMWWYSHYCGKPWMVGETGLSADGDSISYEDQVLFMQETYCYARQNGAIGFGWWEFQDCPGGVNFEARHTGLRDRNGRRKPVVNLVHSLGHPAAQSHPHPTAPPTNYYNMLAYQNVAVTGRVIDDKGKPIEGAVVRGWNTDWSVGMNTYTDHTGCFRLVSNDICTHFEISAPHYSKRKFSRTPSYPSGLTLPNRTREYQQIPLLGWGTDGCILPSDTKRFEAPTAVEASIGDIKLKRL